MLGGGATAVLLGMLLATVSHPLWLAATGVLVASIGAASLIAAAGYRSVSDDAGRRFALAVLLVALTIPVGCFLWFQEAAAEVAVDEIVPTPGGALRLDGISVRDASDESRRSPPPVEGTFTSLLVAAGGAHGASGGRTGSRTLQIELPVRSRDCALLEARLGGGCDRRGSVLSGFVDLEITALKRALPLTAEIAPRGASWLELTEATTRTQQSVPTEWSLTSEAHRTVVALSCPDGTPFELSTLSTEARGRCASHGGTYELTVMPDDGRAPALVLNELSEFSARLSARTVTAEVADARLSVDGKAKPLPSHPASISLDAPGDDSVDLSIEQSLVSGLNEVSLSSAGVSTFTSGKHELAPNWIERHSQLVYFVLGILVASLVPTTFDFVLSRRRG